MVVQCVKSVSANSRHEFEYIPHYYILLHPSGKYCHIHFRREQLNSYCGVETFYMSADFARHVFSHPGTVLNNSILQYWIGLGIFTGLYLINTLRHPLVLEWVLRLSVTS